MFANEYEQRQKKVLAIIAEYNPFHNGHKYHIDKSKEITGAEYTIVVMSGNLTQRAEPAIIDKWSRAEMAIEGGADLVLELPAVFATSAAEDFAFGAIKVLNELKIVDFLSFGSESGEINELETLADIFLNEPEEFVYFLEQALSQGISYPKAISLALENYLQNSHLPKVLENPNNVLGIEYIKQIKTQKFPVTAITLNRIGQAHNDLNYLEDETFASGSNIRNKILKGTNYYDSVPDDVFDILNDRYDLISPSTLKVFEKLIFYRIREMSVNDIRQIREVTEGLENRIKKAASISSTFDELVENIKTKRYTESKINRILLAILLNITKKQVEQAKKMIPYVRVLGFNNKGMEIISTVAKANSKIDIAISVSSFMKNIKNKEKASIFFKDIKATDLYGLSLNPILPENLDYTTKVIDLRNNDYR